MMKVLVTGGMGFIGSKLVNALSNDEHDVTIFDLEKGDKIEEGMPITADYDIIYHLASLRLRDCSNNPWKAIDVNVKGTVSILETARRCRAKVIFSSASSVYGSVEGSINENTRISPATSYGATKVAAEMLIQAYHKQYGVDYFIFRFSNVYGVGKGIAYSFLQSLRNDERITIYGNGEQTRDFIYIDDVVHFLLRALEHDKKNMVVNLGCGKATSLNTLVSICGKVASKIPNINELPPEKEERENVQYDITKLKEIFGEEPKTSLEEGLRKIWEVVR